MLDHSWMKGAACLDQAPETMHPEYGQGRPNARIRFAKRICSGCGVKGECLRYAVSNDIDTGIYGGLTYEERLELTHENPQ